MRKYKRLVQFLLIVDLLALVVLAYDRVLMIHWLGSTDLEIRFVVTDIATGEPIPDAKIEIKSEGGRYKDAKAENFTLTTNANGEASKNCYENWSSGTTSGLRFTNRYGLYTPDWQYHGAAPKYKPSVWAGIEVFDKRNRPQRMGPRQHLLIIPIALQKE
jgi:hypothetical protein